MAIMKKKFCPQCGSEDVELIDSNDRWMCSECGFTGKFPEHSVTGRDDIDEDSQEVDPDAEYLKYKSSKRGMEDEEEDEEEMDEDEDEVEPKTKKSKTSKKPNMKKSVVKKTAKKVVKKKTTRRKRK